MARRRRWMVRWHITADGEVIRERALSQADHERLFQSYETTRPVSIDELEELDRASERSRVRGELWSRILLVAVMAALAGLVAGVLLTWVGAELGGVLVTLCGPVVVVSVLVVGALHGLLIRGDTRRVEKAGLVPNSGQTIASREARQTAVAPGTTSSPLLPGT